MFLAESLSNSAQRCAEEIEIILKKIQAVPAKIILGDLTASLNDNIQRLDKEITALSEKIQAVPAEITQCSLQDQGSLVIALREGRDLLKEGSKLLNKILVPAEQHLCQTIANHTKNGITYNHKLGTITATARGFFGIENPKDFWNWIGKNIKGEPAETFVYYANSKKARVELCEKLLEEGGSLPSGIKEHIIATVTIRRKKDGKKEE